MTEFLEYLGKEADKTAHSIFSYAISAYMMVAVVVFEKFCRFYAAVALSDFFFLWFYIIIPTVCFVMALLLATNNAPFKWLYPVVFGFAGMMLPVLLFGSTDANFQLITAVPASVGLFSGLITRKFRDRKARSLSKPSG
jgi:hypothetical protein